MDRQIFLLLGTNIGNKLRNLQLAIDAIELLPADIIKASKVYETEPWGKHDQDIFYNQVIAISYDDTPEKLLNELKSIEQQLGRITLEKWGPRVIDIDILLFRDVIINTPELAIPHHSLHLRRFALIPLDEIARDVLHPVLKKTTRELLAECKDTLSVKAVIQ